MSISWDTDIADVEKFGTSLPNGPMLTSLFVDWTVWTGPES